MQMKRLAKLLRNVIYLFKEIFHKHKKEKVINEEANSLVDFHLNL